MELHDALVSEGSALILVALKTAGSDMVETRKLGWVFDIRSSLEDLRSTLALTKIAMKCQTIVARGDGTLFEGDVVDFVP